ncbi:MAG: bacteriohemerythrin [Rhodospirillales bacterium]|nr:bacteriohemerythrin [Rhodospirillales bacterium]
MTIISKPQGMRTIEWTPSLSVGVDRLDHDHQMLLIAIGLLENELMLSLENNRIQSIADFLGRYANLHFAREERLMTALGFDGLDAHLVEHRDFAKWQENVLPGLEKVKGGAFGDSVIHYLSDWLAHHVREVDMRYAPLFLEHAGEVQTILRASEMAVPLAL